MELLSIRFSGGLTRSMVDALHSALMNQNKGFSNWKNWPAEDKVLDDELSAVSMLESLFAYHFDMEHYFFENSHSTSYTNRKGPETGYIDQYAQDMVRDSDMTIEEAKAELTKVYDNQMKLFSRAIVNVNVHEDSEGVTYNSITYRED